MSFLSSYDTYIACFFTGVLATVLVTPLVMRLAVKLDLVDHPSHRKIHARSTPLMGGLAIFIGMWVPIIALPFWSNLITESLKGKWSQFIIIALAGLAAMLSGVLDDMRGLNANRKLLVQIPLAVLFSVFVAHFGSVTIPGLGTIEFGSWGIPLTILWIIGITNAFNLIDGVDGLATGVAFFVAITNAILAVMAGNQFLALVMLAMAGACLGFLRYNFEPARIFLGDTGSLFLGMTLATTSVITNSKSTVAASMLVAVIVMGYPVLDTLLAIARRSLRGKPVFSADRGHIHHRLIARGLNHRHAAIVAYIVCSLLSLLALAVVAENSMIMVLAMIILAMVLAFGFYFLGFFSLFSPRRNSRGAKSQFKIAHHFGEFLRAKMGQAKSFDDICSLVEQACQEFGIHSMEVELQDNGQAGSCIKHCWTNSDLDSNQEAGTEEKELMQDSFQDNKTGLRASFYYCPIDDEDLYVEHLLQLSLLMESAANRLQTGNSHGIKMETPVAASREAKQEPEALAR